MSGGMDINWSYREKVLNSARKKFGNLNKKDLISYSDWLFDEIKSIECEEKRLYNLKHSWECEQNEISALLKEYE